jgi:hypothetical protein
MTLFLCEARLNRAGLLNLRWELCFQMSRHDRKPQHTPSARAKCAAASIDVVATFPNYNPPAKQPAPSNFTLKLSGRRTLARG